MRRNPLPLFALALAYQITGWILGERIFKSLNSEAMLFTFLVGTLTFTWWLFRKLDEYSYPPVRTGQILWWTCIALGVILGAAFRIQIEKV